MESFKSMPDEREAIGWWREIDESERWQSIIFRTLCATYAVVALVALRVPEYGWTTQKVFHMMNFIVNGLRAILFGLYKTVFLLRPSALEMALLDIPSLLFFSTYTLLVLFWADIYYQARSLPIGKPRPTYLAINGLIYLIQVAERLSHSFEYFVVVSFDSAKTDAQINLVDDEYVEIVTSSTMIGIWIYIRISPSPVAVEIAKLFFSDYHFISFLAALAFLLYGGRLFLMLSRFPIESKGRQKKLNEVGAVTGICCTCFIIRCFVVAHSAFNKDANLDVLYHPILNFIYYLLVEILPSVLVLFILRKLPPKRVCDKYHPIR